MGEGTSVLIIAGSAQLRDSLPILLKAIPQMENIHQAMVAMSQIEELGRRIGREFDAHRVVLFGSYAQGTATKHSDVDLLVVAETSLPPRKRYGAVRRLLADCPAAFDIIVKTPDEYARWRTVVNTIVHFAEKSGRVLYER